MSAKIAIAKNITTRRVVYIDEVDKTKGEVFECCECKQKMSPVKTEARRKDWHFRHTQSADMLACRSKALHDFVVQVILDKSEIVIHGGKSIKYTPIRSEAPLLGRKSDALVNYNDIDLHFEVFVTHDLEPDKITIYKQNKVRCIKVDFSDSLWLTAPKEDIINAVLNQHSNKQRISWDDEPEKRVAEPQQPNAIRSMITAVLFALGIKLIWDFFSGGRKK